MSVSRLYPSRRYLGILIGLALLLLLLAGLSVLVGAGGMGWGALSGIFLRLRALRLAAAVVVGAGLAMAGVLMQGLFRNPLADPGVIGTSAGALLGGMVMVLVAGVVPLPLPPSVMLALGCLGGGLLSLAVVLAVARASRDQLTVLLAGVVLSMLFAGLGAAVSAWAHNRWELARALMAFSMGSLDATDGALLVMVLPLVIGGGLMGWTWGRQLDVLLCGEEEAASLGVDLPLVRRWIVVWVTMLVAGSVAVGGGIAFVGLVVPHVLRTLVGVTHRHLLPAAAVGGAAFVVACDIVVRLLPTQGEMPLGVVTGIVGAPVFLWLILRERRTEGMR